MKDNSPSLWRKILDSAKRQGPLAWISLAVAILSLIKVLRN